MNDTVKPFKKPDTKREFIANAHKHFKVSELQGDEKKLTLVQIRIAANRLYPSLLERTQRFLIKLLS